MKIKKRNGSFVDFDSSKILIAITKAFAETGDNPSLEEKQMIVHDVMQGIGNITPDVEMIQDLVEKTLMAHKYYDTAAKYIRYRYNREIVRKMNTTDKDIRELVEGTNEYWNTENSNKNARVVTTQRDYIAGITSTDIAKRFLLPPDIVKAHNEGVIHFHDMDYYAQNAIHNCCLINLDDMLQNGTMINGVMIEKPHRFITACTVATQLITAVSSSQYGGATITLTHLAPFVRDSYNYYLNRYKDRGLELAQQYAKEDLEKEIRDGIQTFNYQINSMTTTNGQSPFLSVNMYLGETTDYKDELAQIIAEMLKQRIQGMKNEKGVYVTPAFPKLLYVLEEDNIHKNSKYYWLTELAAKCTAKRMVPDYISEKKMKEYKNGDCYPCMGCRSFLTPDRFSTTCGDLGHSKNYISGTSKYYGRFNQGVVTISLPDVALSSQGDLTTFWKIFNERLELCHRALRCRHDRLAGVTSDVAPILWQHGALARLEKGEKIKELLMHGYSTISLGYAGLYECVKYMTGESHTQPKGKAFGLKVMQALNDACAEWKAAEDIDYSVYGTPIESTTYKFASCLKRRFGEIEGITDKNYITNSYHIPVFEEINAFEKLAKEAEFQKLSPGGAISYIETPNLQDNIPAVLDVIKFIYDNIMYAELNTKSDYCLHCGYDGEILVDENLEWYCPHCGNRDQTKMSVTRRTCGYLGSNFWNKGRTQEIKERVLHLDNKIEE